MMTSSSKCVLLLVSFALAALADPLPVVLWHGMGDTCCNPLSMGAIKKMIETNVPGVFVYSIEVGDSVEQDEYNGFMMNVNDQVAQVAGKLAAVPQLKGGFNAIGFSQGGQFLRAYVQRYNNPQVHNLFSIGGQHQGVFGFPKCPGANSSLCDLVRKLLDIGAYVGFVQDRLVQAEYWNDPFHQSEYLAKNVFLPDINNALSTKNATYKANMLKLNLFSMTMFTEDTMVQPRESEWFGFYNAGQDKTTYTLQQSPLYQQDWLGLQQLDKQGKLQFLQVVGDHLRFTEQWFIDNIVPNLKN